MDTNSRTRFEESWDHITTPADFDTIQTSPQGYLDGVLLILERYHHPFVLVDWLALRWMGNASWFRHRIDIPILIRDAQIADIIQSLVDSGKWRVQKPIGQTLQAGNFFDYFNCTVLRNRSGNPGVSHLMLHTESEYCLQLSGIYTEIPEVIPSRPLVAEASRYLHWSDHICGPPRLLNFPEYAQGAYDLFARSANVNVMFWIPTMERFTGALLEQLEKHAEASMLHGSRRAAGLALQNLRTLVKSLHLISPNIIEKICDNLKSPYQRQTLQFLVDNLPADMVYHQVDPNTEARFWRWDDIWIRSRDKTTEPKWGDWVSLDWKEKTSMCCVERALYYNEKELESARKQSISSYHYYNEQELRKSSQSSQTRMIPIHNNRPDQSNDHRTCTKLP